MKLQPRALLGAVAVIAAIVLGVVLIGGGSDDDKAADTASTANSGTASAPKSKKAVDGSVVDAGKGGKAKPAKPAGPSFSGDVEQAREGAEAVDDVYENFGKAVEAGVASAEVAVGATLDKAGASESLTEVCDLMSEEAKRETITYAERSAGIADVKWTCEKATGLLLRRGNQSGGLKKSLRAEIVGVNTEGDRATASVRFGGKGAITTIALVKEDGEWKLAATATPSSPQQEDEG